MMNEVVAIIPARGGSVRVKNKNLYQINGLSLIERKILQLKNAGIKKVYVGSDSLEILDKADGLGANVINRDPIACDESKSSANFMIEELSKKIPNAPYAIWAHCTNPFLYSEHYISAFEMFLNKRDKYDSLISVNKIQNHLWSDKFQPHNYDPWSKTHTLAKDLKPLYQQDGGIFIQKLRDFQEKCYFFGKNPFLYEIDPINSFDINTPEDIEWAAALSEIIDNKFNFK